MVFHIGSSDILSDLSDTGVLKAGARRRLPPVAVLGSSVRGLSNVLKLRLFAFVVLAAATMAQSTVKDALVKHWSTSKDFTIAVAKLDSCPKTTDSSPYRRN